MLSSCASGSGARLWEEEAGGLETGAVIGIGVVVVMGTGGCGEGWKVGVGGNGQYGERVDGNSWRLKVSHTLTNTCGD